MVLKILKAIVRFPLVFRFSFAYTLLRLRVYISFRFEERDGKMEFSATNTLLIFVNIRFSISLPLCKLIICYFSRENYQNEFDHKFSLVWTPNECILLLFGEFAIRWNSKWNQCVCVFWVYFLLLVAIKSNFPCNHLALIE